MEKQVKIVEYVNWLAVPVMVLMYKNGTRGEFYAAFMIGLALMLLVMNLALVMKKDKLKGKLSIGQAVLGMASVVLAVVMLEMGKLGEVRIPNGSLEIFVSAWLAVGLGLVYAILITKKWKKEGLGAKIGASAKIYLGMTVIAGFMEVASMLPAEMNILAEGIGDVAMAFFVVPMVGAIVGFGVAEGMKKVGLLE